MISPPPGFWARETGHAPLAPTPLTRPFWNLRTHLRQVAEEIGFLFDTLDTQVIGGWLYLRVVPLVDKAGPPPAPSLAPMLFDTVPELRARVRACVASARADVPAQLVRRWYSEWRGEFAARIEEIRAVDLGALSDADLAKQYETALALSDDGSAVHFRLWGAMVVALGRFDRTCRELLGWDDARSIELLVGTSTTTTEPARAIASLIDAARRAPAVLELLRSGTSPAAVLAADPAFAAAFDGYQRTYGCRALHHDLGEATLAERPALLLDLVRDRLDGPGSIAPTAATQIEEARREVTRLGAAAVDRFEQDLARALAAYPVREDNEFFTLSVPLGLLRGIALQIGARLVARGHLDRADDVVQLEVPELLSALIDGADRRALVQRRVAEHAWTLAHPGPGWYGTPPGPPPPTDSLPVEVQEVDSALWWALSHIAASPVEPGPSGTITGRGVSAGTYRGPVRVIRSEADFPKLQAGDVLVCPMTTPVWSILFGSIGALVSDQGGTLSHPAIIAREFGLPAVVATQDGTSRLVDGQIVTVDGRAGTVRLEA